MDKDVHLGSTQPVFWLVQNPPRLESISLEMAN